MSKDFIKIRNCSNNLFRMIRVLDKQKVKNDYLKASEDYLKSIKNDKRESEAYNQILIEIKPLFMGFQLIDKDKVIKTYLSESVFKAINNLKYILSLYNIETHDLILIHKPNKLRVDIALIYYHEKDLIFNKLITNDNIGIEFYSNSDMLNKSKIEKLVNNYKSRQEVKS